MRMIVLAIFAIGGALAQAADDIAWFQPVAAITVQRPEIVVMISASGDVYVDWERVERCASDEKCGPRAISQALVAVRDGTWKPLKP